MSIPDLQKLLNQARSGRVVKTSFLEVQDQRALVANLSNNAGVAWAKHGGFEDASRNIYTFYPDQIPNVSDPVVVLALHADFPDDVRQDELLVALELAETERGDIRMAHPDVFIATNSKGVKSLNEKESVLLRGIKQDFSVTVAEPSEFQHSSGRTGQNKTRTVVVPSLRLDVVGARGFGVSRAYFQAGVAGGKVRINGQVAGPASSVLAGDTILAEGLGRMELRQVLGDTRRGNHKLEVEVRKG